MRAQDLEQYVVMPALNALGEPYASPAAVQLLLATAAQESHMGEYLHQVNGPALGIYQMEPPTHDLVWRRIKQDVKTLARVQNIVGFDATAGRLVYDLRYATILGRMLYWYDPEPLPDPANVEGLWAYYKRVWNSEKGAATREQFMSNYQRYIA